MRTYKTEGPYKTHLKKEIEKRLPGSRVLLNDANSLQGVPDLTVLHESGNWGFVEVKMSATAPFQPNQEYYVAEAARAFFGAVIYPENEEEVLNALQSAFVAGR